ncbi:MAG: type II toxin-antitoxin system mRNA interferase toxin, RelE/StbE family [Patescibacteria group bacterium]|nr:type II toxin-antitoxin system mRNA interferase toxin, RelE/StbE family [Patescibacteria group bacterium]MBU1160550.1 type II toxin-antitoxin system mRNA interferase toxin, RelE/StbE family [Patescibacteria group bacterium]MBU1684449.1 type II toxin-antitoxin system mRNA interferase toxin, RelE/StbE family [Patescibacteria group bacterium]MBU1778579.1 type II toxin-antitoxin system mRNA interferase toxin, RelE/StbE family [Patescibacteria group bacterium]MBU1987559.1 type II toxin-antitoxin 
MIIKSIEYSRKFVKKFKKLPQHIVKIAIEKEKLFKNNPLHPSLRLHALHGNLQGSWSISLTSNYRIIFKQMNDDNIVFASIGKHDIYKCL